MNDKDIYLIATAANPEKQAMERIIDGFRGFTSLLPGSKEKGIIYGTGAWNKGDIKGSEAMDQAYEWEKQYKTRKTALLFFLSLFGVFS